MKFEETRYDPASYNQESIRGRDLTPRPYDLTAEILLRTPPDGTLLDVGCGSAAKLIPLVGHIKHIIGIDKGADIIESAKTSLDAAKIRRIHVEVGHGDSLRFGPETIDTITYMLCPHNVLQAHTVLIPGGYFIADRIGERDKEEIKAYFVESDGTPRGYRSDMSLGEIAREHEEELLAAGFLKVACTDYLWQTTYTREGLWNLFSNSGAPGIREFGKRASDGEIFEFACDDLMTPNGIVLTQHRVIVIAQK